MSVASGDPVTETCLTMVGQESQSPEYSWPTAGFQLPPFEDHTVPYPGCTTRPDYLVPSGYPCLPTPPGVANGCATTIATGLELQGLNSSIPGGVAPDFCHPPLQHRGLLSPNNSSTDPCRNVNSRGGNDGVFQPAHDFAHMGHMHNMELEPGVSAYSSMHADVAFHPHYVGSPEQNWYQNPMHVYSDSNGITATVVPEILPQHDNHSPIHRDTQVSYECPKFKLTQERALPLVRWYEEHQDHPYPSRQDKLHLCQATQLTYTQVSTWFANARRRYKKRGICQSCTSSDEGET